MIPAIKSAAKATNNLRQKTWSELFPFLFNVEAINLTISSASIKPKKKIKNLMNKYV